MELSPPLNPAASAVGGPVAGPPAAAPDWADLPLWALAEGGAGGADEGGGAGRHPGGPGAGCGSEDAAAVAATSAALAAVAGCPEPAFIGAVPTPAMPPAPGPAPATPPPVPALDPEALHPALWRAHRLGRRASVGEPSGFDLLDAELPGGGWPAQSLTELLLPHPGVGELRLLAPALAALQREGRTLMWLDPPAQPCAWTLAALGLDLQRLLLVRCRAALRGAARQRLPAADILWAAEQALKSGQLGALLLWLPARLPADALRRLQLAAQAHDGPAFLLRDAALARQPSPAPLRLVLAAAGPDALRVTLLKRRGPPAAAPLRLALPPVLSEPAQRRVAQIEAQALQAVQALQARQPPQALRDAAPRPAVHSLVHGIAQGLVPRAVHKPGASPDAHPIVHNRGGGTLPPPSPEPFA